MYKIYQLIVLLPVALLSLVAATLLMIVACPVAASLRRVLPCHVWILTRPDWWGTLAARWCSRIVLAAALLPVKVVGRENIPRGQSCVFAANHQGAFDIFLICAYLGVQTRWMMKRALERIPLFGSACRHAGYIFVDRGGAGTTRHTIRQAETALRTGASLTLFPEGRRTHTGQMGEFRRGAFMIAQQLGLPIVPLTINGSYIVMPRHRDWHFLTWHPLSLTIHPAIAPSPDPADLASTMQRTRDAIASALEPIGN